MPRAVVVWPRLAPATARTGRPRSPRPRLAPSEPPRMDQQAGEERRSGQREDRAAWPNRSRHLEDQVGYRHRAASCPASPCRASSTAPSPIDGAAVRSRPAGPPTADGGWRPSGSRRSCRAAAAKASTIRASAASHGLAPGDPRHACRLIDDVDQQQQDADGEQEGADRGDDIDRIPAHVRPIGVDAPRHAQQAGDVHRKESRD